MLQLIMTRSNPTYSNQSTLRRKFELTEKSLKILEAGQANHLEENLYKHEVKQQS